MNTSVKNELIPPGDILIKSPMTRSDISFKPDGVSTLRELEKQPVQNKPEHPVKEEKYWSKRQTVIAWTNPPKAACAPDTAHPFGPNRSPSKQPATA